jgi:hypothetical protein
VSLKTKVHVTWLADTKAGYGHAFKKPGLLRALCGARTIHERFAWPVVTRCPLCAQAIGEMV